MAIVSTSSIAIAFGVLAVYLISRLFRSKGNGLPLPPGPKGMPVLGNLNDLPKSGEMDSHHWLKHLYQYGT